MTKLINLTIGWAMLLLVASANVNAATLGEPFDQQRFDRLIADGTPVLVSVHADWCSTCRIQDRILGKLVNTPPYNQVKLLRVDFDAQKAVVRAFHVQWQSTLILYANGREMARSIADTDQTSIAEMLRRGISFQ